MSDQEQISQLQQVYITLVQRNALLMQRKEFINRRKPLPDETLGEYIERVICRLPNYKLQYVLPYFEPSWVVSPAFTGVVSPLLHDTVTGEKDV